MRYAAIVVLFTLAGVSLAAPAKKPAVRKAASSRTGKAPPTGVSTKTISRKKGKRGTASVARPYVPQAPSPERYREIQQALVSKGYLNNEPTGVWDQQSADALRRFQTENNLSPTGKLSAASLIGLGLGSSTSPAIPSSPADTRSRTTP